MIDRLVAASALKYLLPAHGEVGGDEYGQAFYCRPCLRWVDVIAVDVETAKSMHATVAHKRRDRP